MGIIPNQVRSEIAKFDRSMESEIIAAKKKYADDGNTEMAKAIDDFLQNDFVRIYDNDKMTAFYAMTRAHESDFTRNKNYEWCMNASRILRNSLSEEWFSKERIHLAGIYFAINAEKNNATNKKGRVRLREKLAAKDVLQLYDMARRRYIFMKILAEK